MSAMSNKPVLTVMWDWFRRFCGSGPDNWVKPHRASDPLNSSYTGCDQSDSCWTNQVLQLLPCHRAVMSLWGLWIWGRRQLFPWSCSSEPLSESPVCATSSSSFSEESERRTEQRVWLRVCVLGWETFRGRGSPATVQWLKLCPRTRLRPTSAGSNTHNNRTHRVKLWV